MLAAAVAAGVASTFGAPMGGNIQPAIFFNKVIIGVLFSI